MTEKYYRYVGLTAYNPPRVQLVEYVVVRRTPSGVWLREGWDREGLCLKWVRDGEGKRLAHATKDAAMRSFMCRQRCRLRILTAQRLAVEYFLANPVSTDEAATDKAQLL